MKRPNRKPDFIGGDDKHLFFYFEEMICWNDGQEILLEIKYDEKLMYYHDQYKIFVPFEDPHIRSTKDPYLDWVIEREILL